MSPPSTFRPGCTSEWNLCDTTPLCPLSGEVVFHHHTLNLHPISVHLTCAEINPDSFIHYRGDWFRCLRSCARCNLQIARTRTKVGAAGMVSSVFCMRITECLWAVSRQAGFPPLGQLIEICYFYVVRKVTIAKSTAPHHPAPIIISLKLTPDIRVDANCTLIPLIIHQLSQLHIYVAYFGSLSFLSGLF